MKNEKRFLNVLLSVALILCSLFPLKLTSVSAEVKSACSDASEISVQNNSKVPNKSSECQPNLKAYTSVFVVKPSVATETTVTKTIVNQAVTKITGITLPESCSTSLSIPVTCVILGSTAIYKEAKVGNVTVKCGEKAVVPLELDSINNSAEVVVSLPKGITCEKVVDNSGNQLKVLNDDLTSQFTMTDTKAFITYSVDKNFTDGKYNFDYEIIGIYYRTFNDRQFMCSAIYNVSGGDFYVTGNLGVTTTAVTNPVTTVTTSVTTTGLELPVVPIKPVKGDANGDGQVRASDAAFIAKLLAEASIAGEKIKTEDYPAADFNEDGKITASDAAAIAKYLAEQSIGKRKNTDV